VVHAAVGCKRGQDAPAKAIASKQGLTADGNPNPTGEDRCAMCAMRVADHPEWVGAIELASGDTFYFCCVRCTLATSLQAQKFLGAAESDIRRVRVPDYLHKGKSIDADGAWFIVDSDVRGPMGLAIVPASSQQDADTIVKRHQGRILRRAEVTLPVLMDLKQRSKGG